MMLYLPHLLLLSFVSLAIAAHSRRRQIVVQAPPRYDRSVTTFDPSGRLLQVEYAKRPALRGANVVAAVCTAAAEKVLVVLDESDQKVHRLDHHLWLITCGLSGDARSLASMLRSYCQRHRLAYGEPATVMEVARQASDIQHELTRTGGARPLGCTALVIGKHRNAMHIVRSDPGGTMEDCWYSAAGPYQDKVMSHLSSVYEYLRVESGEFNVPDAASTLAEPLIVHDKEQQTFDIWVFEKAIERRGNLKVTCYTKVPSKEVNQRLLDKMPGDGDES